MGNGTLTWSELSDIVLDAEIAINGRPLSYLEDDDEMPVLTPSSMLHLQPTQLPGLSPHHLQETDLRKRAKYLLRCGVSRRRSDYTGRVSKSTLMETWNRG